MEPLVSVICITRNHERFCIESLNSVLNQTYKNIEWIILDAASTDGTVELIDNWLVENNIQAVFLKEKELKPVTVNANRALTYANGEYVQFLSLDDVLVLDKLEIQLKYFKGDETIGLVFGDAFKINENGKRLNEIFGFNNENQQNSSNVDFFNSLVKGNRICAVTCLLRSSVFADIGNFDVKSTVEDWDLWLRICKSQWRVKYVYHVFAYYRVLENSLWNSKKSNILLSMVYTIDKHFDPTKNETLLNYYKDFKTMSSREKIKTIIGLSKMKNTRLTVVYIISCITDNRGVLRKFLKYNY